MKLVVDRKRMTQPLWVPNHGDDSAFGSLVRWLRYILDTSITTLAEEIGVGYTSLHKNLRLRTTAMKGDLPQLFRVWLYRLSGYRIPHSVVQDLTVVSGHQWTDYARRIRRAILRKKVTE